LALSLLARSALPFCGFYVAKADAKLFNRASQVVLARDGDRTVLTMANDFRGDPTEFAVVVPVPTFLTKEQIHVGDRARIERLDAYSAPRLVEYFDGDPCALPEEKNGAMDAMAPMLRAQKMSRDRSLGVTVEARYTVGEYDILILSAKESAGLETWLKGNGYRIPPGASAVLASYIRQNLRFFVAKVNLKEQARLGFSYLRPIQVAYESPKFMLPIRLGMVNADGPQELLLYALTRRGRVETTNYRTVKVPSDVDVPLFVKEDFGGFYRALFSQQVRRERGTAVFLEYAWNTSGCDPCAADPPTRPELTSLGAFWQGSDSAPADVFLTRLHVRYDNRHFPEDLVLQETADQATFQGRYVLRHPYGGPISCGAEGYRRELDRRHEKEATTLASLTGWGIQKIRSRMGLGAEVSEPKWYEKLWR
jgi:hypothetical protein